MRSILILGGSGFVGTHLALRLREKNKVFLGFQKHLVKVPGTTLLPISVTSRDWIKRVLLTILPDTIIYAVGKNDIQWCEDHAREAEYAHLGGLGNLTTIADRIQAKIIYLSNAYVFDGKKSNYHESDIAVPDTALGKAKLSGENFLKGRSLNWVVVRSAPLLGRGNGYNLSFLDNLRISLSRGISMTLTNREIHNYSTVYGLTEFIENVINSPGIKNRILHYGGLTKVTPFELANAFADRFGYSKDLIIEKPFDPMRPVPMYDFSLNSSEAVNLFKFKPLLLQESFNLLEKNLITLSTRSTLHATTSPGEATA